MSFEDQAKDLYRDLMLQAVMDSANRVVGGSNLKALIAAALLEAYREGVGDARSAASPRERERWAFDDLQKEIGIWAANTFAYSTTRSRAEHLKKEAQEVLDAAGTDKLGEELADCYFLIAGLCHMNGISLVEEVRKKFEINRKRIWGKPNAQGVIEHVRESRL